MARKISVEIVGDSTSLERSFARSGASAKQFEKNIGHAAKGALAGSGAFEHLGRSLAFASGGFVAFAGVSRFLTESIGAARDAAAGQRQLAAQVKASGQSFAAARGQLEKAELAVERFGFTTEDSAHALTVLVRGTGNVSQAIRLQGVVADLARAKNLDLASAANVVAKVFGGQETALRRAVPGLAKHAHGLELIGLAQRKLAGQALAGTTESQRFAATLHDTQVIIGTALLPTLNQLLERVGKWLQHMNESGRLQRDVNSAVRTGTAVFEGLKATVTPMVKLFKDLGKAVGGTKNEVELLAGAFVAFKSAKLLTELGLVEKAVAGVGTAAVTSSGEVGALNTKLGLLARNPALAIAGLAIADLALGKKALTTQATAGDVYGAHGSTFQRGSVLNDEYQKAYRLARAGKPLTADLLKALNGAYNFYDAKAILGGRAAGRAAMPGSVAGRELGIPGTVSGRANGPLTAHQNLVLALAQSPNNVGLLRQQAAFDQSQIAFLKRLRDRGTLSNAKYISEVSAFYSDLNSTLDTITSLTTKAAAAASKKLRANVPGHVAGTAYGITPASFFGHVTVPGRVRGTGLFGRQNYDTPLAIQVAAAKASALNDLTGIRVTAQRAKDAALKAIHSGKLSMEAIKEAWDVIGQANSTLGTTISKTARAVSTGVLTAGLGLNRDTRKALEARLALAGAFSGHVPTTMGVLGQSVHVQNLILPGVRDTHGFADELGKLGRTKPVQTVGHNAGRSRALP